MREQFESFPRLSRVSGFTAAPCPDLSLALPGGARGRSRPGGIFPRGRMGGHWVVRLTQTHPPNPSF